MKRDLSLWVVRARGCSGGLDHLIALRSGDAFFDEPFIITPSLVIFIFAGSHCHFMSD